MERRNLFQKIFGPRKDKNNDVNTYKAFELLKSPATYFSPWSGNLFDSDIVRSAIRPKANAIGKLNAKHIRGEGAAMAINPDPMIKAILQQPNPYMSMQDFLTKITFQRELNHNAFAYVKRDVFGKPSEIYPIPYNRVEMKEKAGELFLRFTFWNGQYITVPYIDVMHLRKDFNDHDFYGESGINAIKNVIKIIDTTDQGTVNAIKNSAIIKWIMLFKNVLRPEDKELEIKSFVKNYLSIDKSSGVVASDPKYELKQVEEKNFVPNAIQTDRTIKRLYSYFGVNENIVQNKYKEDEWNAFYESELEPIVIQLSNAFTKAFFTAREQGHGNRILFEASNLAYASMSTKLALVQMVDRGSMTPDEWRAVLNLGPIEGGSKPIRRLDTAPVDDKPVKDPKKEEEDKDASKDDSK